MLVNTYCEGLDSQVYSDPNQRDQRLRHATVELVLHLLFGNALHISEPQAFDSEAGVRILAAVAEHAPPVAKGKGGYLRLARRVDVVERGIEGLEIPHTSYCQISAGMLSREKFKSGVIPELDDQWSTREEIARAMLTKKGNRADPAWGKIEGLMPTHRRYVVDGWQKLHNAYRQKRLAPGRVQTVSKKRPFQSMASHIEKFASVGPDLIARRVPNVQKEHSLTIVSLVGGMVEAQAESLNDRSQLYRWIEGTHSDQGDRDALREFVDSMYHRTVYGSLGSPRVSVYDTSISSDALTRAASLLADRSPFDEPVGEQDLGVKYSAAGKPERVIPAIPEDPRGLQTDPEKPVWEHVDWCRIFEIVSSREWQSSVENLRLAEQTRSATRGAMVMGALERHVELLSRDLANSNVAVGRIGRAVAGVGGAANNIGAALAIATLVPFPDVAPVIDVAGGELLEIAVGVLVLRPAVRHIAHAPAVRWLTTEGRIRKVLASQVG